MSEQQPIRLTRTQAVEFLNARGYPIARRYFEKISSPAYGQGPRVDGRFGSRVLYLPDDLLKWAEGRVQREPKAA